MGPGKWMNEWMINKAEKVDRKPRERLKPLKPPQNHQKALEWDHLKWR